MENATEIIDLTAWFYGDTKLAFSNMKSMLIVPEAPEAGCVTFYSDQFFKGTKTVLCESDKISYLKTQMASIYKKISSLIIGENTQLRMGLSSNESQKYKINEKNVFKMPRFIFRDNQGTTTLTNLDNVTAYISILNLNQAEDQCIVLYKEKYYQGEAIKYCKKSDGFPKIVTAKSFKIGANIRKLTVGKDTIQLVLEGNDIKNTSDVSF